MKEEILDKKLEEIDVEFQRTDVPIFRRALRAFQRVAPDYRGPLGGAGVHPSNFGAFEGPNLLDKIGDWFQTRYGDRVYAPTDRGKVPVLLRNEIYMIRIPLVYGAPEITEITIFSLIEDITNPLLLALDKIEQRLVVDSFSNGYSLIYEFDDLSTQLQHDGWRRTFWKPNPFLDSALRDKSSVEDGLKMRRDLNGALFHCQQLAEKMMKAVVCFRGNESEDGIRNKYGHNLHKLYNSLIIRERNFSQVLPDIERLSEFGMDIRYTSQAATNNDAIECYWSAMRIGGYCATLISRLPRRYPPKNLAIP